MCKTHKHTHKDKQIIKLKLNNYIRALTGTRKLSSQMTNVLTASTLVNFSSPIRNIKETTTRQVYTRTLCYQSQLICYEQNNHSLPIADVSFLLPLWSQCSQHTNRTPRKIHITHHIP